MNGTSAISRRYVRGLAAGSVWLIAISAVFGAWSLVAIGTRVALGLAVAGVIVAVALALVGASVIRAAARMPDIPLGPGQSVGRRFAVVVGVEVLAFGIVNSWAGASGNVILIPSLDLIIVGLHFVPLAVLFRVPRYHVMALLFCAIPVATLLWFPRESQMGAAFSWYVVPSLGCGAVAMVTAAAGLREAWRSIPRGIAV